MWKVISWDALTLYDRKHPQGIHIALPVISRLEESASRVERSEALQ